jgi:thioredoxin reductase
MSNSRLSGLCISIGRNPGPCGPSGQEKIQEKIQEKTQEKTRTSRPGLFDVKRIVT